MRSSPLALLAALVVSFAPGMAAEPPKPTGSPLEGLEVAIREMQVQSSRALRLVRLDVVGMSAPTPSVEGFSFQGCCDGSLTILRKDLDTLTREAVDLKRTYERAGNPAAVEKAALLTVQAGELEKGLRALVAAPSRLVAEDAIQGIGVVLGTMERGRAELEACCRLPDR